MNALTKKLYISIITLAIAIVAMSTTTFAWFSMSNYASIDQIDATVSSTSGILISQDNINFQETLDLDLTKILNANDVETNIYKSEEEGAESSLNLYPITSLAGGALISTSLTTATRTEDADVTAGIKFDYLPSLPSEGLVDTSPSANVDFLEIKLFVKSVADESTPIYLGKKTSAGYVENQESFLDINGDEDTRTFTPLTSFSYNGSGIDSGITTYDPYSEESATSKQTITVDASNSVRLSIQGLSGTDVSDTKTMILNDKTLVDSSIYAYDRGGVFTVTPEEGLTTENTIFASNVKNFAAVSYYNTVMNVPLGAPIVSGNAYFSAPESDYDYYSIPDIATTEKNSFLTLDGSQNSGSFVVRLWIEGWDGDALDAIISQSLSLNLNFTNSEDEAENLVLDSSI